MYERPFENFLRAKYPRKKNGRLYPDPPFRQANSESREFATLIPYRIALRDWVVSQNCCHVAMERMGIYWMPIYEIFEDAFAGDIILLVVNARHMKNISDKKVDMRDSE